MYEVRVIENFDAAHFLRDYQGRCAHLHGHTWEVEMVVAGEGLGASQLLVDFNDLREMLRGVVAGFDHACLNEVPPFDCISPTSENLARHLFERLEKELKGSGAPVKLCRVRVSESPHTSVTYLPET